MPLIFAVSTRSTFAAFMLGVEVTHTDSIEDLRDLFIYTPKEFRHIAIIQQFRLRRRMEWNGKPMRVPHTPTCYGQCILGLGSVAVCVGEAVTKAKAAKPI